MTAKEGKRDPRQIGGRCASEPPSEIPKGVLDRSLAILDCFSWERPRLQLRDFAARTGLDKATILRALTTLARHGYVARSGDGTYTPGPAPLRLGALYRMTSTLIGRMEPAIRRISQSTGQSTAFYIRTNEERVCLVRDSEPRDFRYFVEAGTSVPLSQGGASAHLLRAYTDGSSPRSAQILRDGRCITRGERNPHLASVAVPVFEVDGQFVGAIGLTGLASMLDDDTLLAHAKLAAREIEAAGFSTTKR